MLDTVSLPDCQKTTVLSDIQNKLITLIKKCFMFHNMFMNLNIHLIDVSPIRKL